LEDKAIKDLNENVIKEMEDNKKADEKEELEMEQSC